MPDSKDNPPHILPTGMVGSTSKQNDELQKMVQYYATLLEKNPEQYMTSLDELMKALGPGFQEIVKELMPLMQMLGINPQVSNYLSNSLGTSQNAASRLLQAGVTTDGKTLMQPEGPATSGNNPDDPAEGLNLNS